MKYFLPILCAISLFSSDDRRLLHLAYSSGLGPIPSNYESLLKVLDTDDKALSREKIDLGKKLFFEKDLSLARDISCASCHSFDKGGADGNPTAIGHKDRENPFHLNTPTVFNTAFSKKFFWNGRSDTLANQAKGPLQAPFEMSITPELAEERISENTAYQKMFSDIYGETKITFDHIVDAISAYEKTIITRGRYDDFLLGDVDALDSKEKEGLKLFITKSCVGCHNGMGLGGEVLRKFPMVHHPIWSMRTPEEVKALLQRYHDKDSVLTEEDSALLKEGFFHHYDAKTAMKQIATEGCTTCHDKETNHVTKSLSDKMIFPFENIGAFQGADDPQRYFLRNVVRTKPYFHNGSVEKLEDAIKLMATHQSRVQLTDEEVDKIIAFLKAADGELLAF